MVWPCGSVGPSSVPMDCDRDSRLVRSPEGGAAYTCVPVTHVTVLNRQGSSWCMSLYEWAPEDLNSGFYFLFKEEALSDWGSGQHKPCHCPPTPAVAPGAEPPSAARGYRASEAGRREPSLQMPGSTSTHPTMPVALYILVGSRGAHLLSQLPRGREGDSIWQWWQEWSQVSSHSASPEPPGERGASLSVFSVKT